MNQTDEPLPMNPGLRDAWLAFTAAFSEHYDFRYRPDQEKAYTCVHKPDGTAIEETAFPVFRQLVIMHSEQRHPAIATPPEAPRPAPASPPQQCPRHEPDPAARTRPSSGPGTGEEAAA